MKAMLSYMSKFIIISVFVFGYSCTDEFLTLTPISDYNAGGFYQTPEQMEQAVNGIYSTFQRMHSQNWVQYCEFRSDNADHVQYDYWEISSNSFNENTTSGIWNVLYQIIYRSNIVLDKLDEVEFADPSRKDQLRGQALFMRGWAYFSLVRWFDGVPLITTEITAIAARSIPRSTVQEVYDQSESDIKAAIELLPESWSGGDFGRISKYAAMGELARLYVQQVGPPLNKDAVSMWNLALPLLNTIISSNKYSFVEDYSLIFSKEGEKGPEIIMSSVYSETGTIDNNAFAIAVMAYPIGRHPQLDITDPYVNSPDDLRKQHNYAETFISTNGDTVPIVNLVKYAHSYNEGSGDFGADLPLLRYTDVLLLKAEGDCEVAGDVEQSSLDVLNMVRIRAGLEPLPLEDVTDMQTWRQVLLEERRNEFFFESIRWWDLVRTNTYVQKLTDAGYSNVNDTWRILPIPLQEIQRHDEGLWQQNPGYEHIQ